MVKTPLRFVSGDDASKADSVHSLAISAADLPAHARDWLFDCEYRQHSPKTIEWRRNALAKLHWFLQQRDYPHCGVTELRQFLAYLSNGHREAGGRWGNPTLTKPVRPRTVKDYHGALRTFFKWLVTEGVIDASPMARLAPPVHRADQIQPFTEDQVVALLAAAQCGRNKARDTAILYFMLDTGIRASELCNLKTEDIDLQERRCVVLGKGNKHRTIYFGKNAARAIYQYLRAEHRAPDEPMFLADRGAAAGQALTRSGLLQLFERLGKSAGIRGTRCSPHTARHYFAVSFLRGGGNAFSLQQLLGHRHLQQTSKYVAFAAADIAIQHRQFSPGDRIRNTVHHNRSASGHRQILAVDSMR